MNDSNQTGENIRGFLTMAKSLSTTQLSCLLASIAGLIPFAIDAYLPALSSMSADLDTSLHHLEFTITSFLVGYATGSLIGGPLSDQRGRRLVAVLGLLGFMAASIAISVSHGFESLLLLRFLQALGGGTATVVIPAIVSDYYSRQDAAKVMTTITFIMMGAPLIAPVFGSGILAISDWRSIFLFLAGYALVIAVLAGWRLPETRTDKRPRSKFSLIATLNAFRQIVLNAQARPLLIIAICGNAIFFCYLTQVAYLLDEYMGVTRAQFPIFFSSFVLCFMVANRCNAFLLKKHDSLSILRWGVMSVLGTSTVFLIVTHIVGDASYWVIGVLVVLLATLGFVSSNSQVNFLHHYKQNSGTATSVMRASELFIGAMAGALISVFYDGTPIPMATVIFTIALIAYIFMRKVNVAEYGNGTVSPQS